MEVKAFFFDRPAVQKSMDEGTHKALWKALSYIRTAQRSMIRRRKKVSQPGSPPSAHSTDPTASVKNILYAYDRRSKYGVVGMVNLNGRRVAVDSNKELPELLEFGGVMGIHETSWDGKQWYSPAPRFRQKFKGKYTRKRNAVMRPRPSARPAFEQEMAAGNIIAPWANVVQP